MEQYKLGRAEYGRVEDCFEDVDPEHLFGPLFYDSTLKMIVGDAGTGKTHLLRLLSQKVPIKLYSLDKGALLSGGGIVYTNIAESAAREPLAVVVDDIHYLLKASQYFTLEGYENIEESVIKVLDNAVDEAEMLGAMPIFVGDDGPGGLSMRISNPELKKAFLEMTFGCVNTVDDRSMFSRILGRNGVNSSWERVLDLNYRGLITRYTPTSRLAWQGGREDLKLMNAEWKDKVFKAFTGFLLSKDILIEETSKNIRDGLNMIDIPLHIPKDSRLDLFCVTEDGKMTGKMHYCEYRGIYRTEGGGGYEMQDERSEYLRTRYDGCGGWVKISRRSVKPLVKVRQLKVLYDEYGEISREALGLEKVGIETSIKVQRYGGWNSQDVEISGIAYNLQNLDNMHRKIIYEYNRLTNTGDLAKALLYNPADETQLVFLEDSLLKE